MIELHKCYLLRGNAKRVTWHVETIRHAPPIKPDEDIVLLRNRRAKFLVQ